MDFAMDTDNLNMALANFVGKVMDEFMEYQIFLPKCTEIQNLGICRKSQSLSCI